MDGKNYPRRGRAAGTVARCHRLFNEGQHEITVEVSKLQTLIGQRLRVYRQRCLNLHLSRSRNDEQIARVARQPHRRQDCFCDPGNYPTELTAAGVSDGKGVCRTVIDILKEYNSKYLENLVLTAYLHYFGYLDKAHATQWCGGLLHTTLDTTPFRRPVPHDIAPLPPISPRTRSQ